MKKIIAIVTFFLMASQIQAQDYDLIKRIKDANGKVNSLEADLANVMVKPRKTLSQNGKLYMISPQCFCAQFTTGKYMIANEKKLKMDIGLFHGTFKLRDGGMMQSLTNIFLYGFQGRVQDLANENNYNIETSTEGDFYVVTETAKRKKIIGVGYRKAVFKYNKSDLLLKEIVLFDYSDNVDTYTVSNVKYNVKVDPKRFEI